MKRSILALTTLVTVSLTIFSNNLQTLALSDQEIKQKLDSVPVFLITNPQGLPLSRPVKNQNPQKSGSVTGVYMSQQEAQTFIDDLRAVKGKDPKLTEIVKTLQVTAVPLGVIYQQLQKTKNQPNHLLFAFKPVEREVKRAMELLRANGQRIQEFKSVPIFAVRFAPDKGYVPIKLPSQKQELIPLFFSEEDAQGLLKQVKPKFPKADIQVIDVDGVVTTFQKKNDTWLNQVVLFPDKAAREYISKLPKNSPYSSTKPENFTFVKPEILESQQHFLDNIIDSSLQKSSAK